MGQAQVLSALEPEWEARFEAKSYGFRPGRSAQDAREAIFTIAKGRNAKRRWALDADLSAAFDRIDHDHLLTALHGFPARDLIAGWLQAEVMEGGRFAPTEEGTPQGGVISPLLLNVALDGMEGAAGVRYLSAASNAGYLEKDSPALVRYADDFVVLCHNRAEAEAAKSRLAVWLAQRGLAFNEDKTRIVHLDEGFDFLGFHVQRRKGKLLITPSKASLVRIRRRIATELRSLRGAPALVVIQRLNPIVRGWSSYYRGSVASEAFASLDTHLWRHTYKWARRSHRNKSRHWVVAQYYGMFNPRHPNRWVFGDCKTGAYLVQFSWTRIVRHRLVKGRFSPDDPTLTEYWSRRRRRRPPPLAGTSLGVLRAQDGLCAVCATPLFDADGDLDSGTAWDQGTVTEKVTRQRVTWPPGEAATLRLVHPECSRRRPVASASGPARQLHAIGTA